jgi:S-DNA-T family DNA segregation ATPase FtsK/SpoIIIE
LPGLSLLEAPKDQHEPVSAETVEYTSRLIERKLADFGVDVKVIAAYPGPVITRYEIEPAVGVKGAQIVNLMKDLARALSLVSVRVVETIPGKTYMGLELPNPKRQIVRLSEIIGSDGYQNMSSRWPSPSARILPVSRCRWIWPRCRMCWWPVPLARANRLPSMR